MSNQTHPAERCYQVMQQLGSPTGERYLTYIDSVFATSRQHAKEIVAEEYDLRESSLRASLADAIVE